jgi:hypothetical protein
VPLGEECTVAVEPLAASLTSRPLRCGHQHPPRFQSLRQPQVHPLLPLPAPERPFRVIRTNRHSAQST